jgi:hypothetical protein
LQWSFFVHGLPSLHATNGGSAGTAWYWHPSDVSQWTVWHWYSVQTTGAPPLQMPPWHFSPVVHALPSWHASFSGLGDHAF